MAAQRLLAADGGLVGARAKRHGEDAAQKLWASLGSATKVHRKWPSVPKTSIAHAANPVGLILRHRDA
ncbi:uncharacterized protein ColSpa_08355 [Colletotrichum spaethianum]|uniref:Uncharacterized protein n=1 Tax=Colletotrichum spaethianum TaxID=700344 RepID=A0AA37P9L8_9PEZI|nr:uncharacterized protein ColSpa_08355 [Colletotrichum spaethianum]GKT48174.1 hypothetical protein ColSpa_08355 [Colletotrichum spaethianum]